MTPDGNFVVSDPGVGVRQPGWHGVAPGTPGGGPTGNGAPGSGSGEGGGGGGGGGGEGDCEDGNSNGTCDEDEDDPCEKEFIGMINAANDCVLQTTSILVPTGPLGGCLLGLGTSSTQAARDCGLDPASCRQTIGRKMIDVGLGCLAGLLGPEAKPIADGAFVVDSYLISPGLAYGALENCRAANPAPAPQRTKSIVIGGMPTARNPFLQQAEMELSLGALFTALLGNPAWQLTMLAESARIGGILTAADEAT